MAIVTGTYKGSNIASISDAIDLIDAYLEIEEYKLNALSGASTAVVGTLTLFVGAENADNEKYSHKITTTLNCPSKDDAKILTAALSVLATAVETESDYTTVVAVDVLMSTTFSN